jgi:MraZ protein
MVINDRFVRKAWSLRIMERTYYFRLSILGWLPIMTITKQHTSHPGDTNLLLGLYTNILENNQPLVLPAPFREAFSRGLYITPGFDRNLMLLTTRAFEAIYNQITVLNLADPVARLLLRMILGSTHETSISADGKFTIPDALKTFARLEQKVILVGQGDFIEVWSPEAWDQQNQQILTIDPSQFSTLNVTSR